MQLDITEEIKKLEKTIDSSTTTNGVDAMSKVNRTDEVFDRNTMEEPAMEYKMESSLDDDSPDTIADPEGVEERDTALTNQDFPFWVFNDYELSRNNVWGSPWPDGKYHLRPNAVTIKGVVSYCDISAKDLRAMHEMIDKDQLDAIIDSYRAILAHTSNAYNVVSSINTITRSALVQRGIAKYSYFSRLNREQNESELPEYMLAAQDKMLAASAEAVLWRQVNIECRKIAGWKEPVYYLDYEVKRSLQSRADYVEKNYRKVTPPVVTASDFKDFDIAC